MGTVNEDIENPDHLHVDAEEIEDPEMPPPCQRWLVSSGLHDLVTSIKKMRTEKTPWLGGLADPPLAKMPRQSWEQLKSLGNKFQGIQEALSERMYTQFRHPCKRWDPEAEAREAVQIENRRRKGKKMDEQHEYVFQTDFIKKMERDTLAPTLLQRSKSPIQEVSAKAVTGEKLDTGPEEPPKPTCVKLRPKKSRLGKTQAYKKAYADWEKDKLTQDLKWVARDPAQFFATVPEKLTEGMAPLVSELNQLSKKELPTALDKESGLSHVDGATRHRYDLVMEEIRNLAARVFMDMKRCGKVRSTGDILSIANRKQGSTAMKINAGQQENTLNFLRA